MPDYTNLSDGTSITILALNEGLWGNYLWIGLRDFKNVNEYTIDVYYKPENFLILLESWEVSNAVKKDGFGRQLNAEEKINGQSEYIEVVINLNASAAPTPIYTIEDELVIFNGYLQKVVDDDDNPLINYSLIPGTLVIRANTAGNLAIFDDGKGGLSGPGGSGTINYDTGEYTIAFSFGNSGDATYDYETLLPLANGENGSAPATSDYVTALDLYSDPNDVDFEFLIEPYYTDTTLQAAMVALCEARSKSIAFLNVPSDLSFTDLILWRKSNTINSGRALFFAPLVSHKSDSTIVTSAAAPSAASEYVGTTADYGPWQAVAGSGYSGIDCIGTSVRYTSAQLKLLLEHQINPIVPHYEHGAILFSQLTSLTTNGVFSQAHVRRLVHYIQSVISDYLKTKIFKINTEDLRKEVSLQLGRFLAIIHSNGGLDDYRVVCNDRNNPGVVIDANELRADVYLIPRDALQSMHFTVSSSTSSGRALVSFIEQ